MSGFDKMKTKRCEKDDENDSPQRNDMNKKNEDTNNKKKNVTNDSFFRN